MITDEELEKIRSTAALAKLRPNNNAESQMFGMAVENLKHIITPGILEIMATELLERRQRMAGAIVP